MNFIAIVRVTTAHLLIFSIVEGSWWTLKTVDCFILMIAYMAASIGYLNCGFVYLAHFAVDC
jgi:hypothetical protein